MNKLLPVLLLLCLALSSWGQESRYGKDRVFRLSENSIAGRDYQKGTVIVKFKKTSSSSPTAKTSSEGPAVTLRSASVTAVVQKFPGGSVVAKDRSAVPAEAADVGLDRIYELKYTGNAGIETVVNELLGNKNVEYAEPSYIHHTYYEPGDPYFSSQQSYLMQVKAPEAWDLIRTARGVVIGIVDSGSEMAHEDLQANMIGGYDLIGASSAQFREDDDPNVVRAENDHGVHVSGLASAVTDNGKGVASIASDAGLFIVKVAADDSPDDIFNGYDGIKYAAEHGADIINCSWGSTNRSFYGEDIINYVISRGCLVVAAGGNNGWETPDYPAGYKGVMAVANVGSNDTKSLSSNYGGYISISAPGNSIYNTTFGSSYGYKSGTSMASPIVASAAALVKSHFPDLSMQQVGEQLRVTADNIDNINSSYAGKLGKGRLNVYRALTESSPSVRYQTMNIDDQSNGRLMAGSTVSVYLELKNFLMPVSGLQVTLRSSNSNVTVTNGVQSVASIGTLETSAMVGPFNVFIRESAPDNTPVEFRIEYSGNNAAYQDYETFKLTVARDYMNIVADNISSTVTSNGRIGFSRTGQQEGLGFQYKGTQLLYEASLMIGNSVSSVSNNVRTDSDGNTDEHFVKRVSVRESVTDSTISGSSEFDDSGSPRRLNIDVRHTGTVFKESPGNNCLIATYEILNTGSTGLTGVYIGTFNDWDIDEEGYNATRYNPLERIAYVYSTRNSNAPYAGVKLLSTLAPPVYYPLTYGGGILGDGTFTLEEKYQTLSSGVRTTGAEGDVSFVSGYGPFTIPANGAVKVAFAYAGGDNLADLTQSLGEAQKLYEIMDKQAAPSSVLTAYPNPVTPNTNNNMAVLVNLPSDQAISLELYNILGQRVKTLADQIYLTQGAHTLYYNFEDIGSGIYLLRLRYGNQAETRRISVLK